MTFIYWDIFLLFAQTRLTHKPIQVCILLKAKEEKEINNTDFSKRKQNVIHIHKTAKEFGGEVKKKHGGEGRKKAKEWRMPPFSRIDLR